MPDRYSLGSKVAIVGAYATDFGRFPDRSSMSLAAEALVGAVADGGLRRENIDGLGINIGYPMGVDYDQLCEATGLRTRFTFQMWTHGRWLGQAMEQATAAVASGVVDHVVLVCAQRFSIFRQLGGAEDNEGLRANGGPHGEAPHYGLTAPGSGAAMSTRRYVERYGASDKQLGAIAVAFRAAAARNPRALKREPIDLDDYLQSRFIIEPLRVNDFSLVSDGACAVVLAPAEWAADLVEQPVYVLGTQGIQAGPEQFVFGRPHLGVKQQRVAPFAPTERDLAVYGRAGVDRDEVRAFYVYDAFSPLVWFALERFGFCGEGEAAAFCEGGTIELGGALPVNTNGGLLSEGHCSGWNHLVEMVAQIRGQADERQLAGADVLQWGTTFGDSVILGREPR